MSKADSPTKLCTHDGCERPLRARGLCVTHYNQQQQPHRHRKVEVACDYCGELCEKAITSKFARRYCSLLCRDLHRIDLAPDGDCMAAVRGVPQGPRMPTRSILPLSHPARWCGKASPVTFGPCTWCGVVMCRGRDGDRCYCTDRCSKRASRERRRGREAQVFGWWTWSDFMRMACRFDYRCAYCGCKPDRLDPDHVVPLSKGGANTVANLLPTCMPCNSDKRDLSLSEWDEDRHRRGLPPRQTSWGHEDRRYMHITSTRTAA